MHCLVLKLCIRASKLYTGNSKSGVRLMVYVHLHTVTTVKNLRSGKGQLSSTRIMAAPVTNIVQWICKELSKLLGVETNEDVARYSIDYCLIVYLFINIS